MSKGVTKILISFYIKTTKSHIFCNLFIPCVVQSAVYLKESGPQRLEAGYLTSYALSPSSIMCLLVCPHSSLVNQWLRSLGYKEENWTWLLGNW